MDASYLFGLLFTIWLLLLVYTCKRQLDFFGRSRKIVGVKKLQYEIRKNLKREQQTFYTARELMYSTMLLPDGVSEISELTELQILQFQINAQLKKLEFVLEFDSI